MKCNFGVKIVAFGLAVTAVGCGDSTSPVGKNVRKKMLLHSVSPDRGTIFGSTPIVVTGFNFESGATVKVGGVDCTSPVISWNSIACNTGATAAAGAVTVEVTNPDGQKDILPAGFTYFTPVAQITSVNPGQGPDAGNYTVDVYGNDFVTGATIRFGAQECTNVHLVTAST